MTQLEINTGKQGAKRQSFLDDSARAQFLRIKGENPSADLAELTALWWEFAQTKAGKKYDFTAHSYLAAGMNRALLTHPARTHDIVAAQKVERRDEVDKIKEVIVKRIHHEAKIILLDMAMPNGKPLRETTGKECSKMGGWLSKIASQIRPYEKVGAALSEEQVRKLYEGK